MNLIGLSYGGPKLRKLTSFATMLALVLSQASLFGAAYAADDDSRESQREGPASTTARAVLTEAPTCQQPPEGAPADAVMPGTAACGPSTFGVLGTTTTDRTGQHAQAEKRRIPGTLPETPRQVEDAVQVDTSWRWLRGYRPNTPEAAQEFESWKQQERLKRANAGRGIAPSAPAGTPAANLLNPPDPSAELPTGEIRWFVHSERYERAQVAVDESAMGGPLAVDKNTPDDGMHSSGLTFDEYNAVKERALSQPGNPEAQEALPSLIDAPTGPIDATNAIFATGSVPPDHILAVGPNHVLVVVNSAYRVWNKGSSTWASAPLSLTTFFSGVPNCGGPFDVSADYDEAEDRFVMAAESLSGATDAFICVGATQTGDPTAPPAGWNRYSYRGDPPSATPDQSPYWIDFLHMGIGQQAVYFTANMFEDAGPFDHVNLYAIDKTDLYAGTPIQVAQADIGAVAFKVMPAKLHGFTSGGWPSASTPMFFVGSNLSTLNRMWEWINPFTQPPAVYGDFVATYGGPPPNAPESGDTSPDQANDTDVGAWIDAEYRNDFVWATRATNCNLGGGAAEACVDWVRIDVSNAGGPVLVEQQSGGGYGSPNAFRYYPDIAPDRNNNIAIGYTKSSPSTFTEVWATGRLFGDAAGTLQAEVQQIAGAGNYTDGVGCGGPPSPFCDRWGDYSGMSVDPDGCKFWYVGQASNGGVANWFTHLGSYQFSDCSVDSTAQLNKATYDCADSSTVTVIDATPLTASEVATNTVITTSSLDSETVAAAYWIGDNCTGSSCTEWSATLPTSAAAGADNDGTLNVANGGTITVDYSDPHVGHADQARSAAVGCQTQFDDGGFIITGGCEDGAGAELYRDYVDAGELVDYEFGIFNASVNDYTDVEATLSVGGPLSGLVTILNPTVHVGNVAAGTLSSAVFQIELDPSADGSGLALHDFDLSVTSAADGLTTPQVVTQQQYLHTDDNIVTAQECFNFESGAQGWVRQTYTFSYTYPDPTPPGPDVTANSIAIPWTRNTGCGSETRTDYPEMTCDTGGTFAWASNPQTAGACNNFPQTNTTFVDDTLYSPILTPDNTGNAGNGQPWNYRWLGLELFFNSDMEEPGGNPALAYGLWLDDSYEGVAAPAQNEIDTYSTVQAYFYYFDQPWDSGTPWNPPTTVPANYDVFDFTTEDGCGGRCDNVSGLATPGLQWRMAIEVLDADYFFDTAPTATPATTGIVYDNVNLVYDQYHAEEQTGACNPDTVPGTVAFDQFAYQECPGGEMGLSVLDSNAVGPVTVTVTSDSTGDSETLSLNTGGPRFSSTLSYSTTGGIATDDGLLWVRPDDTVRVSYDDVSPVGNRTTSSFIACTSGAIVVEGVDDFEDNGDLDNNADTNETVDFTLRIRNDSGAALSNVQAYIATDDPDIECVSKDVASFGAIADGATATNDLSTDAYTFKVSSTTNCTDPNNPPSATFNVFIVGDGIDGASVAQTVSFVLDLNVGGTPTTYTENFDAGPGLFTLELGPGDDDGLATGLDGECAPFVNDFFHSVTGGNPGGGLFAWDNPADTFPNGTYNDLNDAVAKSPARFIAGTSTTLTFDHEYRFANASNLRADGVVVQYSVNGGPWLKVTNAMGLTYDGPLIFNEYCNPLCNGGFDLPNTPQDCFHETANNGENVFCLITTGVQNWETQSATITGLNPGDQIQFRWRFGSMLSATAFGLDTTGGYGLDDVSITNTVPVACDAAVRPDVGCNVVFDSAAFTEVCGDGDGLFEPTEVYDADVTLRNHNDSAAVTTVADLEVNVGSAVAAIVTGNPQAYGTINAGGTSTATYTFEIAGGAACVNDLTFDVADISTTGGPYPDDLEAFAVQVGGVAASETGNQQLNPTTALSSTAASPLSPPVSLTGVDSATLSYSFNYATIPPTNEVATQSTDPLTATNTTSDSTLTPAFTITAGSASSAQLNWTLLETPGEDVVNCSSVALVTPNATVIPLKALGAAVPSLPIDLLSTYNGVNGGPGTYTIRVGERSGGGCNGPANLTGTTMTVNEPGAGGDWGTNVQVSLWDGTTSHTVKAFGVADANPYDVTSIVGAAGPGTYEIRIQENGGGGSATVSSTQLAIATPQCDLGCAAVASAPPVGDGLGGTQMMLASKGAGLDDVNITFDAASCSDDHAVVLRGNFGNFTAYQGAVATGCDAGSTGTASFNQSGSYWFNVVWVNANDSGGHPGFATSGPRTWSAAGFCAVTSDDASDQVCN